MYTYSTLWERNKHKELCDMFIIETKWQREDNVLNIYRKIESVYV